MAQMTPEEFAAGAQQALGREPIKPAPKPLKTTQPPAKPEAKPRAGGLAGGDRAVRLIFQLTHGVAEKLLEAAERIRQRS